MYFIRLQVVLINTNLRKVFVFLQTHYRDFKTGEHLPHKMWALWSVPVIKRRKRGQLIGHVWCSLFQTVLATVSGPWTYQSISTYCALASIIHKPTVLDIFAHNKLKQYFDFICRPPSPWRGPSIWSAGVFLLKPASPCSPHKPSVPNYIFLTWLQ